MNELGDTVKVRRELLGLTQRALAVKVQIQASHVSLLERGLRKPSISLIERLADALVVDRRELLALAYPGIWPEDKIGPSHKRFEVPKRSPSHRVLLRRYHVTKDELRVIQELSPFGVSLSLKEMIVMITLIRHIHALDARRQPIRAEKLSYST
jgi:transcriptional regulator with XRE-family HTH domain